MDFDNDIDIDAASVALILQLQIEDAAGLVEVGKENGEPSEGVLSDTQLAIQTFKEELERKASLVADRKMAKSIARACQTDGETIATEITPEVAPEPIDTEVLAKLEALYVTTPTITDDNTQNQTTLDGRLTTAERPCTACQDTFQFQDLARAPCSHEYCRDCLRDLFRSSLTDETLFPPRCCRQPITFEGGVRILLNHELVKQFKAKKTEFDTPNRTYCSNQLCSLFLQNDSISKEKASCPDCETVTCTVCKGGAHIGDCPSDVGLQEVLAFATEQGWQRCFHCRRLVELDTGCNHITCRCGSAFCYVCGEIWKTCRCRQWDEHMLLARATQIVARAPAERNLEQQEARVAAAAQDLRDRHNCDHERWRRVYGCHQCEECLDRLTEFIFECRQCHLQACHRCRSHRL